MRKTLQRANFHFLPSCFFKFLIMYIPKMNQGENCKLMLTSAKYNLIWKLQMPREQDPAGSNLQQSHKREHTQLSGTALKSTMAQRYGALPAHCPKSSTNPPSSLLSTSLFLSGKEKEIL